MNDIIELKGHIPLILRVKSGEKCTVPQDREWMILGINAIPDAAIVHPDSKAIFRDHARGKYFELPLQTLMRSTILMDAFDEVTDFRRLGNKLKSLIAGLDIGSMAMDQLRHLKQSLNEITQAWVDLYEKLPMDFGSWGSCKYVFMPRDMFSIEAAFGVEFDIFITEIVDAGKFKRHDDGSLRRID